MICFRVEDRNPKDHDFWSFSAGHMCTVMEQMLADHFNRKTIWSSSCFNAAVIRNCSIEAGGSLSRNFFQRVCLPPGTAKTFFLFSINTISVNVDHNMNAGRSRLTPPPQHCVCPWHTFKNRWEVFSPSTCSISWSTSSALRRTLLPLLFVPVPPLDCLTWNASFCRPRLDTSEYCIRPRPVHCLSCFMNIGVDLSTLTCRSIDTVHSPVNISLLFSITQHQWTLSSSQLPATEKVGKRGRKALKTEHSNRCFNRVTVSLWHSDLDVNIVISVAVTVHLSNALPLQPDNLVGLTTGRNLQKTNGLYSHSVWECVWCYPDISVRVGKLLLTTILMGSYRPCALAVPPRMAWATEMNTSERMFIPSRL